MTTQAAKMIMDDHPLIPLLQCMVLRLDKPYVGEYRNTDALDRYRAKDIYIIEHRLMMTTACLQAESARRTGDQPCGPMS